MKKVIGTMVVVFAIAAFTMTAFAQPGGRGPGGPGGRPPGGPSGGIGALLRNDEIKSQLGLSEEQISKLEKIAEESRSQRGSGLGAPGGNRQGPPSAEEMKKFREEMEKRADEASAKVNQVLTPEQQEKLKVLQFQMSGGLESPFLSVRSLDVLNLTDEQKAQLKVIGEERDAEGRAAFEKRGQIDWRNLPQEEREKLGKELQAENEARAKKYSEKIKAILTPEQKATAEKLSAGVQELREKVGIAGGRDGRRGGGQGGPEGEYRPGQDSWRPGQGAGGGNQNRQPRRSFPQSE